MIRIYQISEVLASGKEVYVGIDVHKESFHVTAIAVRIATLANIYRIQDDDE